MYSMDRIFDSWKKGVGLYYINKARQLCIVEMLIKYGEGLQRLSSFQLVFSRGYNSRGLWGLLKFVEGLIDKFKKGSSQGEKQGGSLKGRR